MEKSITYKLIILIVVSFVLGIITVLVVENYFLSEKIEFSTLGLLGFVFSIIFAGSSIVLAITAINLGRSSEKAMIERSEKSIELQNEVYIKTTEALQKIESSTGVTEKRIEDIISGRVGDIASRLVDDNIVTRKDKNKLERELRRSLSIELTEEEKKEREEKKKHGKEAAKQYNKFKEDTLLYLTNLDNSKTLRVADGAYGKEGVELLDGLFEINNNKVGVCAFYSDPIYTDLFGSEADEFLNNLATEIAKNTFDRVFLAFNELSEMTDKFNKEIEKIKSLYKQEIADKIILISGIPEEIGDKIKEYVP